jgi:hypothetical protein
MDARGVETRRGTAGERLASSQTLRPSAFAPRGKLRGAAGRPGCSQLTSERPGVRSRRPGGSRGCYRRSRPGELRAVETGERCRGMLDGRSTAKREELSESPQYATHTRRGAPLPHGSAPLPLTESDRQAERNRCDDDNDDSDDHYPDRPHLDSSSSDVTRPRPQPFPLRHRRAPAPSPSVLRTDGRGKGDAETDATLA